MSKLVNKYDSDHVKILLSDLVWDQVQDQISDQISDQVRNQVWDRVYGQVRNQVKYQVNISLFMKSRNNTVISTTKKLDNDVSGSLRNRLYAFLFLKL